MVWISNRSSQRAARVDLLYQGSEQRLRLALQQASMTLTLPRLSMAGLNNAYGAQGRGSNTVYELYLNQYAPKAGVGAGAESWTRTF